MKASLAGETLLAELRERLHPLNWLRSSRIGRVLYQAADVPVWMHLPDVRWRVRARALRHAAFWVPGVRWEEGVRGRIKALCESLSIRTFLDVGANIGLYGWLVKSAAPEANIRLYEPDPDNAALLRHTLRDAGLDRVAVREVAVSDRCGHGVFAKDTVSGTTGSLERANMTFSETHWRTPTKELVVETVSLDAERALGDPVDLIKIDVEGHEASVLRGAQRLLVQDEPIVFFEQSTQDGEAASLLARLGYQFWNADTGERIDAGKAWMCLAVPERRLKEFATLAASGCVGPPKRP